VVHLPLNGVTMALFFLALLGAVASTLMPAVAYLNARFGRFSTPRAYRARFVRQSLEIGLFVVVIGWLRTRRVLDWTVASILLSVFILIETFMITREVPPAKG
jgi:hypothetical protein